MQAKFGENRALTLHLSLKHHPASAWGYSVLHSVHEVPINKHSYLAWTEEGDIMCQEHYTGMPCPGVVLSISVLT